MSKWSWMKCAALVAVASTTACTDRAGQDARAEAIDSAPRAPVITDLVGLSFMKPLSMPPCVAEGPKPCVDGSRGRAAVDGGGPLRDGSYRLQVEPTTVPRGVEDVSVEIVDGLLHEVLLKLEPDAEMTHLVPLLVSKYGPATSSNNNAAQPDIQWQGAQVTVAYVGSRTGGFILAQSHQRIRQQAEERRAEHATSF